VEVGILGWGEEGWLHSPGAIEWWDQLHALGHTHIAPIGGSDDHHGGAAEGAGSSPIGHPTTLVLAANLSHGALLEGVRLGRTAVKFYSPGDPSVDLTAAPAAAPAGALRGGRAAAAAAPVRIGGTLQLRAPAALAVLTASVTAAAVNPAAGPFTLQLVRNNEVTFSVAIAALPFRFNATVPAPLAGTDRWRAEVHDAATLTPRTLTNHIFLPAAAAAAAVAAPAPAPAAAG
jgi:hypothetical protein